MTLPSCVNSIGKEVVFSRLRSHYGLLFANRISQPDLQNAPALCVPLSEMDGRPSEASKLFFFSNMCAKTYRYAAFIHNYSVEYRSPVSWASRTFTGALAAAGEQ